MNKRTIHLIEQNQEQEKLSETVNVVEIHMNQEDAWFMARHVQDMGRQTILRRYAKPRVDTHPRDAKRLRAVHDM